jgi:1,4-dihydroxy-2-naphthoate octaprenyltransferase
VLGAVAYTLPPLRAAYRPVVGELIAFLCLVLCVTGAYRLAGRTPGVVPVVAGVAVGAFAVSMLMVHHYLDHDADRLARPPKRTTIVWLGRLPWGRRYSTGWNVLALAAAVAGTAAEVRLAPLVLAYALALPLQLRCDPLDVRSVTTAETGIILLGIAGALAAASLLAPPLALFALPAALLLAVERAVAPAPDAVAVTPSASP